MINNKNVIIVGIINPIPPKLVKKSIPGLSKLVATKIVENENNGIDQSKNLLSFLRKGKDNIKRPSGITKNWVPPQDAKLNPRNIPDPINLDIAIL